MKVICDFCLIPQSQDLSLSPYIAECQRIFSDLGLSHRMHAYGTNLEGEWDSVMDAIKRCHMRVHEMGPVRISSTLKLGTRTDRVESIAGKVDSVRRELGQEP